MFADITLPILSPIISSPPFSTPSERECGDAMGECAEYNVMQFLSSAAPPFGCLVLSPLVPHERERVQPRAAKEQVATFAPLNALSNHPFHVLFDGTRTLPVWPRSPNFTAAACTCVRLYSLFSPTALPIRPFFACARQRRLLSSALFPHSCRRPLRLVRPALWPTPSRCSPGLPSAPLWRLPSLRFPPPPSPSGPCHRRRRCRFRLLCRR